MDKISKGILEFGSLEKYIEALYNRIDHLNKVVKNYKKDKEVECQQDQLLYKSKKASNASNKYKAYLKRTIEAGYEMDLTPEDFDTLISMNCYYCNQKGGTIDRMDSNIGYTYQNSKPCCLKCNLMKNNMPIDVFLNHINQIYKNTVNNAIVM